LILGLSDLVKPYAKKMEYLSRVRDGSEGKLADGYWLCQVIGVKNEGNEITPLYGELYSSSAKDFDSENHEIRKALRNVSRSGNGRPGSPLRASTRIYVAVRPGWPRLTSCER
jgi:hypothetical protein